MSVTFVLHTRMGPYISGTFSVTIPFAQQIVQRWGNTVTIQGQYPGTNWFQPGTTLHVWPLGGGPGPQPPFPPGPIPGPSQPIQVIFRANIYDPSTGTWYNQGRVYSFTLARLQALAASVGPNGIVFLEADGDFIPVSRLYLYQGRTIYADQPIYAYRANQDQNGNGSFQTNGSSVGFGSHALTSFRG